MTVADYSIPELATLTTCEVTTGFAEPGTWTYGGAPADETDYYIQGTHCVSKTFGGASPGLGGLMYDSGSDQALAADEVFLCWVWHAAPPAMDTYSAGGMRLMVGSANTAFKSWFIGGSDITPYSGWKCVPVDPAITSEETVGSPTAGVHRFFGMAAKSINAIAKGNPLAVDVLRQGRGTLLVKNGEAGAYGTFSGAAAEDQNPTNRWGLMQLIDGTYVWQGHFKMGVAGTVVDFRDSNKNLVVANTLKVQVGFNKLEIVNASSRVDWTNISITALGTVSRGDFVVTDNADVNLLSCTFDNMGTFSFLAATDALSCIFRSCGAITAPGSNLSGSSVLTSRAATNTSAVIWDANVNPSTKLANMTFSKGTNAHHAIEFGTTSPLTMELVGVAFGTGFNASNEQNDSTLHILRSSGTVNITLTDCTGNISYKSAGATVNLISGTVPLSVHVQDVNTDNAIVGAQVLVEVASGVSGWPYQESVTITRTGGTATVEHVGHGLVTNDWVSIKGANQAEYNGTAQITRTDNDHYTYAVSGTPATPATGSITSTFNPISGVTDGSGNISNSSYTFSSDQLVTGRVRKATAGTLYKTSPISGTIDTDTGFSATILMIPDS